MAKLTVLDMVQDILGAMNSDDVNSISDTQEAYDVARIIKNTYEDMMADKDWPHLQTLMQLTAVGATRPTHMTIPDSVQRVLWIKYNKRTATDTRDKYTEVTFKEPVDFLELVNSRDSSATNIDTIVDASSVSLFIRNDIAPTYWTTFDDETIVMDAYDSALEANLQTSKSQCFVYKEATFTISDTHTPDLPSKSFPQLVAQAKATSFSQIKQVMNGTEESKARRLRQRQSRENWRLNGGVKYPNYGKVSVKS